MNHNVILHICRASDWSPAAADYRADSLSGEGFIHCSTPDQVVATANAMFRGQKGLLLLVIDPARVGPEIVYEDCYESGQAFPHIYGPLNREAVLRELPFPPGVDGTFTLPDLGA